MTLRKAAFTQLERVFSAEILGMLPYQTRSRAMAELEEAGYVEKVIQKHGTPPLVVTVKGWVLTHAGRIYYCDWASKKVKNESIF